jgi:hypothetical protein
MSRMNPMLVMALMMASQGLPTLKEEKELTVEEKALLEERRRKYEWERTKGDRNLKAIEEARKKNGLPPLNFGKRSDEK